MREVPRISEAEWEVMKIVWEAPPLTANDIIRKLEHSFSWNPKTIRTLITRLVQKGALGYHDKGKSYEYYPLVEESDCMRMERQSFLKKMYGGALKPMLVHFLQEQKLSTDDIAELKRLLEQKEKE